MSPRPKRRTPTSDLREQIVQAAWRQIAQEGAAALSLRAIARALNISAPSIYHYFEDRDALVTALIVQAFHSFADHLQAGIADCPLEDHAGRLHALGLAYRDWALTYPERYQLIFGTPLAGYHAPVEITQPAAGRSLAVLVGVLMAAFDAGKLRLENTLAISPELRGMFETWQSDRGVSDERVLRLALTIWTQVHGMVLIEIGRQYPPFVSDPGRLYRHYLGELVARHF